MYGALKFKNFVVDSITPSKHKRRFHLLNVCLLNSLTSLGRISPCRVLRNLFKNRCCASFEMCLLTGGPNSVLCFEFRELVWRLLVDTNQKT